MDWPSRLAAVGKQKRCKIGHSGALKRDEGASQPGARDKRQIQGFGEFELKLLNDTLTITPGVKVQDFTRMINTPIAAPTSREGIDTQQSYKPTLPYLTINYLIRPDFSVYGQIAAT